MKLSMKLFTELSISKRQCKIWFVVSLVIPLISGTLLSQNTRVDPEIPLPGSEKGARKLVSLFLEHGANHQILTNRLRPTRTDFHALYKREVADQLYFAYQRKWEQKKILVKPRRRQTNFTMKKATVQDLILREGESSWFPSGYHWIIPKLRKGHTLYIFTFKKQGEQLGITYDGLVFVNNHWVIIPEPWKVLREYRRIRKSERRRTDPVSGFINKGSR